MYHGCDAHELKIELARMDFSYRDVARLRSRAVGEDDAVRGDDRRCQRGFLVDGAGKPQRATGGETRWAEIERQTQGCVAAAVRDAQAVGCFRSANPNDGRGEREVCRVRPFAAIDRRELGGRRQRSGLEAGCQCDACDEGEPT